MEDSSDFGGATLEENNTITNFDEKKSVSSFGWVNAGAYIFNKSILSRIPANEKVSLEKELFPAMADNGLFGFTSESQLLDIGTPERLERARKLLIELN